MKGPHEPGTFPYNGGTRPVVPAPYFLIDQSSGPAFVSQSPYFDAQITLEDIGIFYGYYDAASQTFVDSNPPTNTTPTQFPPAIKLIVDEVRIRRCTIINAYDAINVNTDSTYEIDGNYFPMANGRLFVEDCLIGAYHDGITLDHIYDVAHLVNTHFGPFWASAYLSVEDWGSYNQATIAPWVFDNANSILALRVDGLWMSQVICGGTYSGVNLTDSADTSISPRCAFGMAVDFQADECQNGLIAESTQPSGFHVTNFVAYANPARQSGAAVYVPGGGTLTPRVSLCQGFSSAAGGLGAFASGYLLLGTGITSGTPPFAPFSTSNPNVYLTSWPLNY